MGLLQGRAKTLPELVDRARPFFTGRVEPDPEAAAKHWKDRAATRERLTRLGARLEKLDAWDEASLERELRSLAEELEVGAGKLIHPLRVALTGVAVSPGIFELMNLMGRVLARIGDALAGLGTP